MFRVPNDPAAPLNAATFEDQAESDKVDWDILAAAVAGDGVLSGCNVTAQVVPDMTVQVAAGTVIIGAVAVAVAGDAAFAIAAAGAQQRFDLVVVDNVGAISAVSGPTDSNAVLPNVPANSIALAAVYVPAAAVAVQAGNITGKRALVLAPADTVVSEIGFGQAAAAGTVSPYSRADHTHGTPVDPVTAHVALPNAHHTAFVQADADALYETIGAVATHAALADPHTVYGALAQAETWAALQTFSAGMAVPDNQKLILGTGSDAEIYFDGNDLILAPDIGAPGVSDVRIPGAGGLALGTGPGGVFLTNVTGRLNITASIRLATSIANIEDPTGAPRIQIRSAALNPINFFDAAGATRYTIEDATPHHVFIGDATISGTLGVTGLLTASGAIFVGQVEIQSTVGALLLPRMTTAQRNALTAVNGMIIYNTTTGTVESYEGGVWVNT